MWRAVIAAIRKKTPYGVFFYTLIFFIKPALNECNWQKSLIYFTGLEISFTSHSENTQIIKKKVGMTMKRNNKFEADEVVILISTGEKVTINKSSYISNMKRYSYTIKENPSMFYFEDELETID
jgi:hypothetical protein